MSDLKLEFNVLVAGMFDSQWFDITGDVPDHKLDVGGVYN